MKETDSETKAASLQQKQTQPSTSASENLSSKETLNNSLKSEESKAPNSLIANDSIDGLRAQIRELHEKLIFANETIAMMEDQKNALQEYTEEDEEDKLSGCSAPSANMVDRMINNATRKFT